MGKMKELSQILDEMVDAGNGMIEAANALRKYFSSVPDELSEKKAAEKPLPVPVDEKKVLSKEDVRKLLVAKSQQDNGTYKPQVKALVRKYSETGNLSAVKPEQYEALVAELGAIGNA